MRKSKAHQDETVVLVFSGEYDLGDKQTVRTAFDGVVHKPRVVLDFSDVSYIDSTVLSELVRFHRERGKNERDGAILVSQNKNVRKLLGIAGLTEIFQIVDVLDDAVGDGVNARVLYASPPGNDA